VSAEDRQALRQSHDARDGLYTATLEEFGEHALVRLFPEDEALFDNCVFRC